MQDENKCGFLCRFINLLKSHAIAICDRILIPQIEKLLIRSLRHRKEFFSVGNFLLQKQKNSPIRVRGLVKFQNRLWNTGKNSFRWAIFFYRSKKPRPFGYEVSLINKIITAPERFLSGGNHFSRKSKKILSLSGRGFFCNYQWLPRMDSNHGSRLQRAVCYHYTTGQ